MNDIRMYIQIAVAAALILLGWKGRGYYEDSHALAELKGAQAVAEAERAREDTISRSLESKLAALDERQWVVFRDRNKVVTKTVYRNQCLDDDGVRLINASKGGTAGERGPGVPTTP